MVMMLTMISRRLRWWRARGPTHLSWSSVSTISGNITRAATVTMAAATVTHTTARRQPHIRLMAAVSGLPTTSARLVPT